MRTVSLRNDSCDWERVGIVLVETAPAASLSTGKASGAGSLAGFESDLTPNERHSIGLLTFSGYPCEVGLVGCIAARIDVDEFGDETGVLRELLRN